MSTPIRADDLPGVTTDSEIEEDRGLWTIPNGITFLRLVCLPVFLVLLFHHENRAAAAWILAVSGMTDWVDGYIARHWNQISNIGKIIDPVADRLLFFVGVTAILIDGSMPLVIGIAILAREVLVGGVTVAIAAMGARRIDVMWFGKAGTFANMMAVPSFLGAQSTLSYATFLHWLAWITVTIGLVLSYLAAFRYIPLARQALNDGRADRQHATAKESPA